MAAPDRDRRRLDTVGRAIADSVIEVVDDAGEPVAHDGTTIGNLIARSSSMSRGYWNKPDATSASFRDGWYHSSDLGSLDENGYVRLPDRRTDLILSGGANVYPVEIERVLLMMPAVRDAAVVGAPHPRWGQTPVAFIVTQPGTSLSEDAVIEHCRQRIASYKKSTRVVFVDALPRNSNEKVLKAALREMLSDV